MFVTQVVVRTALGLSIVNRSLRSPPPSCNVVDGFLFDDAATLQAYRQSRPSALREEIPEADALALFNEMRNSPDLPFRYPEDGCYARAHQMARMLELRGYDSRKMFVEGDLRTRSSCAEAVPRKGTARGELRFQFHVAPTVMVRRADGSLVKMVMDPSLFARPVTVAEWQGKLIARQRAVDPSYACTPFTHAQLAVRAAGKYSQACHYYESPRYRYLPVMDPSDLHSAPGPGGAAAIREPGTWNEGDLADSNYTLYQYGKIDAQRRTANPQCVPAQ